MNIIIKTTNNINNKQTDTKHKHNNTNNNTKSIAIK